VDLHVSRSGVGHPPNLAPLRLTCVRRQRPPGERHASIPLPGAIVSINPPDASQLHVCHGARGSPSAPFFSSRFQNENCCEANRSVDFVIQVCYSSLTALSEIAHSPPARGRCSPNHCGIIPRPRGRGTPASRLDQAPCPFIILLFSVSIGLHFARRRLMEHGGVASHLGSADARYILHYFGATSTPA